MGLNMLDTIINDTLDYHKINKNILTDFNPNMHSSSYIQLLELQNRLKAQELIKIKINKKINIEDIFYIVDTYYNIVDNWCILSNCNFNELNTAIEHIRGFIFNVYKDQISTINYRIFTIKTKYFICKCKYIKDKNLIEVINFTIIDKEKK